MARSGWTDGQLVTSGLYGWTMVVTGTGPTIAAAQAAAYDAGPADLIPNVRYRLDIGDRLIAGDYARLERLDLLVPTRPPQLRPCRSQIATRRIRNASQIVR